MTSRDRTALFLRYREQARALHRPSHHTRDASDPSIRVTRSHMQPDWLFAYNDLRGDVTEIRNLLELLVSMYAKHLLPSFEEKDTSLLESDIRTHSHRLTQSLHTAERKLRNITKQTQPSNTAEPQTHVETRIRINIQKRFAAPLQELSMSFRKRQKTYFEKLKELREIYDKPSNSSLSTAATLVDMHPHEDDQHGESTFSETQLLTVESASALTHERTQELNRVAANIYDLASLVNDIASFVVDQGTVLDRIDYNLEHVNTTTFKAVRELRIADRYQRKRHALCCIIILAIACGIMFVILVYKWTS